MRRLILILGMIFILFINSEVYAVCDTADISRLKNIAKNVEVSYEHNVYGNFGDVNSELVSVYDFTVSGLTDELLIIDNNGNRYYDNMAIDGVINFRASSGKNNIYIFSRVCSNVLLDTRTFDLSVFNFNSLDEECQKEEFKELDICSEFFINDKEIISSEEFKEEIVKVKEERKGKLYKIIKIVKNNLLYVIIGVLIIVIISVILFLRHRKRSVLE